MQARAFQVSVSLAGDAEQQALSAYQCSTARQHEHGPLLACWENLLLSGGKRRPCSNHHLSLFQQQDRELLTKEMTDSHTPSQA